MIDRAPVFTVSNKHVAATDSGKPPHVDGDTRGRYHGYFENEYSEQAVFVYDRETGSGNLWMGDTGWEEAKTVIDGQVSDLVLGQNESL